MKGIFYFLSYMLKTFTFSLILISSLSGCSLTEIGDPRAIDYTLKNWLQSVNIFFTQPGTKLGEEQESIAKKLICDYIKGAKQSIDVCIYELSEPEIYNAIIEAFNRGINVRFVGDSENMTFSGYIALSNAHIPMVLGNSDKIMHNKFIIIDDILLITGSANFTYTGFYKNNENILFIRNSSIANYYKKEFDNIFYSGKFGTKKTPFEGFLSNTFELEGYPTKVFFTPYYSVQKTDEQIIYYITNAQKSIHFAIFSFTHRDMASNMIKMAKEKGIELKGVFDKYWHTGNVYSVHDWFFDSDLDVVFDGNENVSPHNPYHGGKLHSKFMVIDGKIVITGSLNFSAAGAKDGNDENVILFTDPRIASLYEEEFLKLFNLGYNPIKDAGGDEANEGEVLINEILWAGSKSDSGVIKYEDQFIELKNMTSKRINISGWRIFGLTKKSYRIRLFIFPKGSYLEPNEHVVVCYSTNKTAFYYPKSYVFNQLYLYHSTDQNYVYLELKDPKGKIIDKAGDPNLSPFAGGRGSAFQSMKRIGSNGLLTSSWTSTTTANNYVLHGYKNSTFATPGTD